MNKTAYTLFVAFVASLLTLAAVQALTPQRAEADDIREITLDELAEHDHRDSCWKAINGRVYDITDYVPNHPTPERVLTEWCGQESTSAWDDIGGGRGHSASAAAMLERYRIGVLAGSGLTADDLAEPEQAEPESTEAQPVRVQAGAAVPWADGSYYAELEPDGRGWIPIIEITIVQGDIVAVHYDEVQRDEEGQVTAGKRYDYGYAQNWRNNREGDVSQLTAFPGFAWQLISSGDPAQVDIIVGATSSYDSFVEAAELALADAAPRRQDAASDREARADYQDGVYFAESKPNERGYSAMIEIWVRGGMISHVHYDEIARNEAGEITERKLYDYQYAQRWRNAMPNGISQLTAFPAFGQQLIATGDPDQVDVLSGATGSHEWFQEMAREALSPAQ